MGNIFDVQRFCLHDGPGIRTTVFFKGCPLRCRWCSNPESQKTAAEFMFSPDRCMQCGLCVQNCPLKAPFSGNSFDSQRCLGCGECVRVCPTGALVEKGHEIDAEALLREVQKDEIVFKQSGGGVTVSGGEPFMQPDFLRQFLQLCKAAGLDTCIESSFLAEWGAIAAVLPLLDHVFCDVKHPDSAIHREGTGVDNQLILENAKKLSATCDDVTFRIPVIPGFNTSRQAQEGFIRVFSEIAPQKIELLPYHIFGEAKYGLLKRDYPGSAIPTHDTQAAAEELCAALHNAGYEVCVVN